jgi:hypothetical protein
MNGYLYVALLFAGDRISATKKLVFGPNQEVFYGYHRA